jgi:glutathione synthase/RimK-type ligase-like ATP-grasp enzyme
VRVLDAGILINWGCGRLPVKVVAGQQVINTTEAVNNARCKLRTFQKLERAGVSIPPFYTPDNVNKAPRKDNILVARTTTTGSAGAGIVIVRDGDKIPAAPLYTTYIKKDAEYRFHVVGGKVILIQQKRKESDVEQTKDQKLIRNRDNGWIFSVNNVVFRNDKQKQDCIDASIAACNGLGLHFGAVDLVVEQATGKAYVLEINTAPGIESPTLAAAYRDAFQRLCGVE